MTGCSITPKAFQHAVNTAADHLLAHQLKTFVLDILVKIQDLIICVTGIDILLLLQYLTILAVIVWLYNLIKNVVETYLCWFKCKPSHKSSTHSDNDSDCDCH
jgi:hypothetical protein